MRSPEFTLFLLSPANLSGKRGAMVLDPKGKFPLAERLRSKLGAPLGDIYSFVSGLYFRGKVAYAGAFGRAPEGLENGLVISPGEGLRFLSEPVTVERLREWSRVSIDAENPRYTEPLIQHAKALEAALGERARFVLLGSVATEKYVRPLERVFGERLLFPRDFVGRGDMSRGALMLRAASARDELAYAPIAGTTLRGPRAPGVAPSKPAAPAKRPAELVIFVGLPGAGKTSFYKERFVGTHVHISKDNLRSSRRKNERQQELLREALGQGRSVAVDNTNVGQEERARLIAAARQHGATVIGYFFDCTAAECVARNARREGRARIPNVGIFAARKRLVRPSSAEGFDELFTVRLVPDGGFDVSVEYSSNSEPAS